MPAHCQQPAGGWLSSSWLSFKKNDMGKVINIYLCYNVLILLDSLDECKRYREAIFLDPKYSIAITEVFSEMFSKMMIKPIETLGESIYSFNKSVLSK